MWSHLPTYNLEQWLEDVAFVAGTMYDLNEPQTFQQAWWKSDKDTKENGVKQSD